jgi:hypothetical protein
MISLLCARKVRAPIPLIRQAAPRTGNGSGAIIEWNPTEGGTYLDGTPRDATSELPHEFYHAFIMQSGELGDTKAADNPSIFQDEVEATEIQNGYLQENGLPTIGKYCHTLENGLRLARMFLHPASLHLVFPASPHPAWCLSPAVVAAPSDSMVGAA